jgi:hypothetical protein
MEDTRRPRRRVVDAMIAALDLTGESAARFRELAVDTGRVTPVRQLHPDQPVSVNVLGPLIVRRGQMPVPIGRGKRQAVLGRLALSANAPVPLADLIELLDHTDLGHQPQTPTRQHPRRRRSTQRLRPTHRRQRPPHAALPAADL